MNYFQLLPICVSLLLMQIHGGSTTENQLINDMRKHLKECFKELHIFPISLTTLDENKIKCLPKCRAIKGGYMQENGKMITENVLKIFNSENDKEKEIGIRKCLAIENEDLCQKASEIQDCMQKHSKYIFRNFSKFIPVMKQCSKELNVSLPLPQKDFDDKAKCMIACYGEKLGWAKTNGDINIEIMARELYLDKNDSELQKCWEINNENKCEKAVLINKCIQKIIMERIKRY